eukprot:206393-Pyramimonas_sp.AAC.1
MGAGCRTLGNAPVRTGTPSRQHAPIALSDPPMGMGVCCWFVTESRAARRRRPGNGHQPTGGCLHRGKVIPDLGAGGKVSAALGARIVPPPPRSGSSSLGGGTPPIL